MKLHGKRWLERGVGGNIGQTDAFFDQRGRINVLVFARHRDFERLAVDKMGQVVAIGQQQSKGVSPGLRRQHCFHLALAKVHALVIKRQGLFEVERKIAVDQQMMVAAFAPPCGTLIGARPQPPVSPKVARKGISIFAPF